MSTQRNRSLEMLRSSSSCLVLALLVAAGVAIGCGQDGSATATTSSTPEPLEHTPSTISADAVHKLRLLLMARHPEDLPGHETLDLHPNAEAILHALAADDTRIVVRARALALLALYPTPATRTFLMDVAQNAAEHPKLKAAALRGLAGQDLSAAPEVVALAEAALRSTDPRVEVAAAALLDAAVRAPTRPAPDPDSSASPP